MRWCIFVEKSDEPQHKKRRNLTCAHFSSPRCSALTFPSRRMPLGWLLVSLVPHRMRRNIPALFVDRRGEGAKLPRGYVHAGATPGTDHAGVFPPRPPGARASDGALFLTFGLAEFVYVYYTRSKWDDGSKEVRCGTPLVQGRT